MRFIVLSCGSSAAGKTIPVLIVFSGVMDGMGIMDFFPVYLVHPVHTPNTHSSPEVPQENLTKSPPTGTSIPCYTGNKATHYRGFAEGCTNIKYPVPGTSFLESRLLQVQLDLKKTLCYSRSIGLWMYAGEVVPVQNSLPNSNALCITKRHTIQSRKEG